MVDFAKWHSSCLLLLEALGELNDRSLAEPANPRWHSALSNFRLCGQSVELSAADGEKFARCAWVHQASAAEFVSPFRIGRAPVYGPIVLTYHRICPVLTQLLLGGVNSFSVRLHSANSRSTFSRWLRSQCTANCWFFHCSSCLDFIVAHVTKIPSVRKMIQPSFELSVGAAAKSNVSAAIITCIPSTHDSRHGSKDTEVAPRFSPEILTVNL